MDTLILDLRYALRQLRSKPWFTAAAVATLALGIGVNAAVFSLANWIVLRPVPGIGDQGRLVIVEFRDDRGSPTGTSYPNLADLREGVSTLSGLAGYTPAMPVVVVVEGQKPQYRQAAFVSASYFSVLNARLALGRPFSADEEVVAQQVPVAIISHRLWTSSFGADSGAIGGAVTLNGVRTKILGVAPIGFHGTDRFGDADFWIPGSAYFAIGFQGRWEPPFGNREAGVFMRLVGRLAPGSSAPQAQPQLRSVTAALIEAYPDENADWETRPPTVFEGIGVPTVVRGIVRRTLTLLGGIAGIVLLIACANVANLFLFRGVGRRAELAVRQALGASASRLMRAQFTESLVVAVLSGFVAVPLIVWLAGLFRGPLLPGLNPVDRVRIDWWVLGFTGVVALIAGVVSGVAPAVAALRADVLTRLQAATATVSAATARLRGALAVLQLSLSLSLLIVAFLLIGTLRNLRGVDVGFDANRIATFSIHPVLSGYSREQSHTLMKAALAGVRSLAGVEEAALAAHVPFTYSIGTRAKIDGSAPDDAGTPATDTWVSPTYFRTMGIPLLAGRTFRDGELFASTNGAAERVTVLSETLAQRLFGISDPIGRLISTSMPGPPYRVIGLAGDSRWATLTHEGAGPLLYQPLPAFAEGAAILVRSSRPLHDLQAAVSEVITALAPSVPAFDAARLSDRIDRFLSQERLLAEVLTVFTLLAVILAGVGLYSVVVFAVAERTKELGIRIAIGARPGQIVGMVLTQGAWLGGLGVAGGLAIAVGLSRLVANRLYGITPVEPAVYVAAATFLFLVVLAASLLPARTATRVDPMVALRAE
jgi:predicted permease